MAEARANPSFGGYDDEFVSEVGDDWHCPICQLPLKEPVQTVVCGHRFCRQCLDGHFVRQEHDDQQLTCPVDRNCVIRDKDIFPDKAVERMILSFIIKCPYAGCEWTGELRTKTAHQNECKRFPLDCPNICGAVIPREESLETVDYRTSNVLVTPHDQIPAHVEKDCTITVISCPYGQMGCTTMVQRKEVETHLQSDMRLHLDFACTKFSDTQKELFNTKEVLRNTQDELRDTQEELHNTQDELRNTQEELRNTQDELRNTQEELRNTQKTTIKLEEKINALENKPLRCQNVFTWKISGFREMLAQAKSGQKNKVHSVSFYLGECGYKFRICLYPNGIRSGRHTHLSLYVNIMKGEYDSILNWPFRERLAFSLIDQEENPYEKKDIVKSFSKERGAENWNARPKAEENHGRGFTEFVSHDEMQERQYLVDDTMFIKVKLLAP